MENLTQHIQEASDLIVALKAEKAFLYNELEKRRSSPQSDALIDEAQQQIAQLKAEKSRLSLEIEKKQSAQQSEFLRNQKLEEDMTGLRIENRQIQQLIRENQRLLQEREKLRVRLDKLSRKIDKLMFQSPVLVHSLEGGLNEEPS
ncbi:MAG: hypothetical protein ACKVQC_10190 [Elusimicrobiota bacterium]